MEKGITELSRLESRLEQARYARAELDKDEGCAEGTKEQADRVISDLEKKVAGLGK